MPRPPRGRGWWHHHLTAEAAEDEDLEVGDTFDLVFFSALEGFGPPDQEIEPIGVEPVTVVGIGTLGDESLPDDDLYPRSTVILSPELVGQYDCLEDAPPPDLPPDQALPALLPPDCAISYRYWSLQLTDGAAGTDAAEEAFAQQAAVDGTLVTAVVDVEGTDQLTVVEGRLPDSLEEIALGHGTVEQLGLELGDEVEVGGGSGLLLPPDGFEEAIAAGEDPTTLTRPAQLVGTVVMPALGPYQARRASPGEGAHLASDWIPPGSTDPDSVFSPAGFIGVELADGADPEQVLDDVGGVEGWSPGDLGIGYSDPVRLPQITNTSSMRNGPLLLAGVLLAAMVIALGVSLALSVRARRHELAVLRVLGLRGQGLTATVLWQTIALLVVGLAVGTPVGIAVGRAAWRGFADQLQVDRATTTPWGWMALTVVGVVILGLVAAALPARAAAQAHPVEVLREE